MNPVKGGRGDFLQKGTFNLWFKREFEASKDREAVKNLPDRGKSMNKGSEIEKWHFFFMKGFKWLDDAFSTARGILGKLLLWENVAVQTEEDLHCPRRKKQKQGKAVP